MNQAPQAENDDTEKEERKIIQRDIALQAEKQDIRPRDIQQAVLAAGDMNDI